MDNNVKQPIFFLDHGMKGWVKQINEIISKLPSGAVPDVLTSFGKYGSVSGRKLLAQHKNSKFALTLQMGYATIPKSMIDNKLMKKLQEFSLYTSDDEGWERFVELKKSFDVYPYQVGLGKLRDFQLVSFNTSKYKTVEQLSQHKQKVNEQYKETNGSDYWVNLSGELTIWHEFGHVFNNNKYISNRGDWKSLVDRWIRDGAPHIIKVNTSEAFSEAFANVIGDGGKNVPTYIKDYVLKVTS